MHVEIDRFSVISWNLNHWRQSPETRAMAWDHLDDALSKEVDWDVALLQECLPPEDWPHPIVWCAIPGQRWGTAVTTRWMGMEQVLVEDDSHPGCVVAARVPSDLGPITVASMYGLQEYARSIDGEPYAMRYAVTAVHRMLSDLTPLIDREGRSRSGGPLVIGGDLNVSTQMPPPDRRRHAEVLDRFAGLGLTDGWDVSPDKEPAPDCDCPDAPGCGHVRTHTHNLSIRPWQLDHVFANRHLRFRSCRTLLDADTWMRSDHAPVLATFSAA
jgi:endonuclease/exonuclease/phosphatase family metal-dependent hydrolase